jgi:hypothetical protein
LPPICGLTAPPSCAKLNPMRPDRSDTTHVSFDVLLLFVLLLSRVRIDTLAEWAAIPSDMLHSDVVRLLGGILSPSALTLLSDKQTTDPVTLLLISVAFACFLVYVFIDLSRTCSPRRLSTLPKRW